MSWLFDIDRVQNWSYAANVFCPDDCKKIIEIGNAKAKEEATVLNSQGTIVDGVGDKTYDNVLNNNIRKNNVAWLNNKDDIHWVYRKLTDAIQDLNRQFFGFDLYGFTEDLQFTEYNRIGDHYDYHTDNMYFGLVRKLSVSVQLSDPNDYDGGDLLINTGGEPQKMKREQGTITVFPSYNLHKVTPIERGTRYSLVGWVSGPNFK